MPPPGLAWRTNYSTTLPPPSGASHDAWGTPPCASTSSRRPPPGGGPPPARVPGGPTDRPPSHRSTRALIYFRVTPLRSGKKVLVVRYMPCTRLHVHKNRVARRGGQPRPCLSPLPYPRRNLQVWQAHREGFDGGAGAEHELLALIGSPTARAHREEATTSGKTRGASGGCTTRGAEPVAGVGWPCLGRCHSHFVEACIAHWRSTDHNE